MKFLLQIKLKGVFFNFHQWEEWSGCLKLFSWSISSGLKAMWEGLYQVTRTRNIDIQVSFNPNFLIDFSKNTWTDKVLTYWRLFMDVVRVDSTIMYWKMLKLLQTFALFVVEALSTLINCLFLILALNRIFPDLVEFWWIVKSLSLI